MKVQSVEDDVSRQDFIFARALEEAQKDGVIPKNIHFVKSIKEDISTEYFIYRPEECNFQPDPESYVVFMKRMKETIEHFKCDTKDQQLEMVRKILKDVETLHDQGFFIQDIYARNIMVDENNVPHFLDYGQCWIQKKSIAHRYIKKFKKQKKIS